MFLISKVPKSNNNRTARQPIQSRACTYEAPSDRLPPGATDSESAEAHY